MDIYTQGGLALRFQDSEVFIHIYPHTDILVGISREAALHLYKLMQKYNYTVKDPQKWGKFWQKITQVERTMTCMFLEQNGFHMGLPFRFMNREDLPQDFAEITMAVRLPKIPASIKTELEAIYNVYVKAVVLPSEVKDYWEKEYPGTSELLKKNNRLDNLVEVCFDEESLEKIIRVVLNKEGKSAFEKPEWCEEYTEDVFQSLVNNEVGIFSSVPHRLAGWKMDR